MYCSLDSTYIHLISIYTFSGRTESVCNNAEGNISTEQKYRTAIATFDLHLLAPPITYNLEFNPNIRI